MFVLVFLSKDQGVWRDSFVMFIGHAVTFSLNEGDVQVCLDREVSIFGDSYISLDVLGFGRGRVGEKFGPCREVLIILSDVATIWCSPFAASFLTHYFLVNFLHVSTRAIYW
jgi:hypothetical protein